MCVEIYTKEHPSFCISMYQVHSDPDPVTVKEIRLQMGTHWQCGGLLYPPNTWVRTPDTLFICVLGLLLEENCV